MKDFILSAFADEAASDIKGQILNMQKNGISGLEIRNANGKNITELSLDEVKEIKKQLSDAGLFTWLSAHLLVKSFWMTISLLILMY